LEFFSKSGEIELAIDEKSFKLKLDHLNVKRYTKLIHVEEFVPSVIEPSFGIGRIMYSIWEHNFVERDAQRTYLALPTVLAPYKCSVLPLSNNEEFKPLIKKISALFTSMNISHKVDDSSGSIGRRYARTDEVSVPYAITIDFESLKEPHTVTLRERDSMQQVRLDLTVVKDLMPQLCSGLQKWADVTGKYPILAATEKEE